MAPACSPIPLQGGLKSCEKVIKRFPFTLVYGTCSEPLFGGVLQAAEGCRFA